MWRAEAGGGWFQRDGGEKRADEERQLVLEAVLLPEQHHKLISCKVGLGGLHNSSVFQTQFLDFVAKQMIKL
jgi:hypothetical protein